MADAKIITYGEPFSATTDVIPDNQSVALDIESVDGKDYIQIDTTDGSEKLILGGGINTIEVGSSGTTNLQSPSGAHLKMGTTGAQELSLATSDTTRIFVDSAGKISTGNPSVTGGTLAAQAGSIHVYTGNSAQSAIYAGADDLILEGNDDVGITFCTTATKTAGLYFNKGNGTASNYIRFAGASEKFEFKANTAGDFFTLDGSKGALGVNNTSPTAIVDIKGNLTTNLSDSTSVISDLGAGAGNTTVTSTAHGLAVGSAIKIDSTIYTVASVTGADVFVIDSAHGSVGDKGQATTDPSLLKVLTGDGGTALELTTGMQLQIPNGSVTRPSLRFAASGDTGFFSPGAGQIAATVDADDAQGGIVMLLEGTEDTPNGKNNTAIGPDALKSLINYATPGSRGSYNVGVGGFAASNITTGTENMAIGRGSLWNAATTSHKNVGVGVNTLSGSGVKTQNTAVGHNAGLAVTTGTTNVMVGYQAGDAVTTTGTGTYVGASTAASAATSVSNETCLGYAAVGQGSNTVMLGDSNVTGLHCYDDSVSSPSDSRIKNNVEDSTLGLDFISALRPVKYQKKHPSEFPEEIREARWSDQIKTETADNGTVSDVIQPADTKPDDWQPRTQYGLIAQEVKAVMEAQNATDWQGHTVLPSGMESLAYGNLVTVLVSAVQELKKRIEELENDGN